MSTISAVETMPTPVLFAGLAKPAIKTFLKGGHVRKCVRGQILYHQGTPVTHFYLIQSGVLQLCRTTPAGHQKTIEILKSGQTLCESEIMDACTKHRANALAVEDAVLIEFPVSWIKENVRVNTTFALNLLSMISQQAHMAELEAEHQAHMSAPQLVACFLQRLCIMHDFNPKSFELPYSKSLIASRLGMEAETFSRALRKLKANGIEVHENYVSIHDFQKIEHYVCGLCSVSEDCATHQAIQKKIQ